MVTRRQTFGLFGGAALAAGLPTLSFAAAIACSSDWNDVTGATGPKISSLSSLASGVTSPSTVGSKK